MSAADRGTTRLRVLPAGTTALLVETGGSADVAALLEALRRDPVPGVTELVPAARTMLLHLSPGADRAGIHRHLSRLADLDPREAPGPAAPAVQVPVRYDGEDLSHVARHLGLDVAQLVARHTAAVWTVAFCGFAPGFGYLVTEDSLIGGTPPWNVPRRDTPRTRVPAGSVALAGGYSAVYPGASPGGWQLIGRTDLAVFDVTADPPALLSPGTRVRFMALP